MYVNVYGTSNCGRGRGDGYLIDGAVAAVPVMPALELDLSIGSFRKDLPEIIRRVAVSNQDNCNCGIVLDGIDAIGRARVVLLGMRREGSKKRFSIHHQHVAMSKNSKETYTRSAFCESRGYDCAAEAVCKA